MSRTLVVLSLLVSACAPVTVTGEIDGATPELLDVFYLQSKGTPFGDESKDGSVHVLLMGFTDACSVWTGYLDEIDAAAARADDPDDYPEDFAEIWARLLPEQWWTMDITIRTDDPTDPIDNVKFDGTDWERTPAKSDEFSVDIKQYDEWLDEEWARGTADPARYYQQWLNDEGVLVLNRSERNGRLDGVLTTDLVEADGDDAGSLELSFSAERCGDAER